MFYKKENAFNMCYHSKTHTLHFGVTLNVNITSICLQENSTGTLWVKHLSTSSSTADRFHLFSVPCRFGNSHLIILQRHMNSVCTGGTCSMASQHGHCCMLMRENNSHPLLMMKPSAYRLSELRWRSRDPKPLRWQEFYHNSLMNSFSHFLCKHNSAR